MLSLERTHASVVSCWANPGALDALAILSGTHKCRVAPDEVLLLTPPALVADVQRHAAAFLATVEPSALILDQSDGWAMFTLRGDEADHVFAQLSVVPPPSQRPAFVQGAVAGGSAKMLFLEGCIHVLVPSTLHHHLAARLRDVCGDLVTIPATETPFVVEPAVTLHQDGAATPALR